MAREPAPAGKAFIKYFPVGSSWPSLDLRSGEPDVIESLEAWAARGRELRAQAEADLERAREELRAAALRVERLEAALARTEKSHRESLPSSDLEEQLEAARDQVLDLSRSTISEAIEMGVRHFAPRGAPAMQLKIWASEHGKTIKTKILHTYLSRMLADERVAVTDATGAVRRYGPGPKLRLAPSSSTPPETEDGND